MNISKQTFLALAGCVLASASIGMAPAHAQDANGWNYAIDSFHDGIQNGTLTGPDSNYEFYGLAIKETEDRIYVGINSNLKLGGESSGGASDGKIHYGDLFFNFTGEDLSDAEGNLFAVKFDAGNDSGVSETGVYGNVTSMNVTEQNSGFSSVTSHYNRVNTYGDSPSMGELDHYEQVGGDYYFQQEDRSVSTSISTGTFLGGIEMLESGALSALGLNFPSVDSLAKGDYTFGFSFARDLMVDGDYVAHLFAECMNDGMAITGNFSPPRIDIPEVPDVTDVPEPALATGLFLIGGLGLLKTGRKETAEA